MRLEFCGKGFARFSTINTLPPLSTLNVEEQVEYAVLQKGRVSRLSTAIAPDFNDFSTGKG